MINIDSARPGDLDEVMRLEELGFPATERWSRPGWAGELAGDHRIVLAARTEARGPFAGVIAVTLTDSTADLLRVVVDPGQRRQQIGRRLVDAALDRARDAGVKSVMLEVRYDNEPAIALYQAVGFEQLGVRSDYYGAGVDALVLKIYDLSPMGTEPGIGRHAAGVNQQTKGADR